jgi:cell division protein FtsX
LVGAEGVDRVVDSESLVADQTNRFRHWRDWGLAGTAILSLSAVLVVGQSHLRRRRVGTR